MEEATGAPSSLAVSVPKRLRASGRDGETVMTEPPSPLRMLLSRHTKRREFITLLGGAVASPLAARAQQAGRTYRLGVLHNQGPQSPQFPPFYDELRRRGFVEGQNLIVDSRGYAVRTEQFPAVAAELVKAQVDAILAGGAAAARAAQAATRTIPILTLTDFRRSKRRRRMTA